MSTHWIREIDTGRVSRNYVVRRKGKGQYRYTTKDNVYDVDILNQECNCPSRQVPCKHCKNALDLALEEATGLGLAAWAK
tara:strand:+ start:3025 stop:3264 length:240 start_codon:yes stop_codon:yes gene_type:complete